MCTEPDDDPLCGTPEAAASLAVIYVTDGSVRSLTVDCCCSRHIPRPADVLPPDAVITEVTISDARQETRVRDGTVTITMDGYDTGILGVLS